MGSLKTCVCIECYIQVMWYIRHDTKDYPIEPLRTYTMFLCYGASYSMYVMTQVDGPDYLNQEMTNIKKQ